MAYHIELCYHHGFIVSIYSDFCCHSSDMCDDCTPVCCEETVCSCSAPVGFQFFNEIYEKKKMPIWDKGGLFLAFIKGEDEHGRCEKKNNLKDERGQETTANIDSRNGGMTFTANHPWIRYFWSRNLIRQRSPCASLRIYSGITGKTTLTSVDYENQNYANVDTSKHPVTNGNATGAKQPRAANGRKIHSHPMLARRQVYSKKVRSASLEKNFHGDARVPSSQVTVLPQNSADKTGPVNVKQEIGRSSMCIEKRRRRSKAASVGCSSNVDGDHSKKVTSQDIECSSLQC